MKRILFPATNRVHLARQQLLLTLLKNQFDVDIQEYRPLDPDISRSTADITNHFMQVLGANSYDLVLIRGDRFEMLPIAMLCAYKGIPIAHIEGGDISGAIDNKVRKAITALADVHFSTNKESFVRLISMGTDPDWTFNFGSLDVEYAKTVKPKLTDHYIVMCHHAMKGEDPALIEKIIREEFEGKLIVVKSNSDNGTPYGSEEFDPEAYLQILSGAMCLVGNSSSFLKEASVWGIPVLNIGNRQQHRLKPHNVKDVPFEENQIRQMLKIQINADNNPSDIYFKPETSKRITEKINKWITQNISS